MLRVAHIKVSYDEVPALHEVSFQVERGPIVSIVGPNGAGKRTILKAASGEFVIPAKAGIQLFQDVLDPGACPGPDPGFAGVTLQETFYEFISFLSKNKP